MYYSLLLLILLHQTRNLKEKSDPGSPPPKDNDPRGIKDQQSNGSFQMDKETSDLIMLFSSGMFNCEIIGIRISENIEIVKLSII